MTRDGSQCVFREGEWIESCIKNLGLALTNVNLKKFLGIAIGIFTGACLLYSDISPFKKKDFSQNNKIQKLYWFIPDGFRADHGSFNIYEWAQQGEMPNLKFLMDHGCWGYSKPVFPGHTPVNFATLMTGVSPAVHGVVDGSMRLPGYPLNVVMKGGFSSFAKLVPPIWVQMENAGEKVTLQSIPGSTPPELFKGNTIKGRWGAWGAEIPSVIFQDSESSEFIAEMKQNKRVFNLGSELTKFVQKKTSTKWTNAPKSYEVDLTNWGAPIFGRVQTDSATGKTQLSLSQDRDKILARVSQGEWTDWIPITLHYELKNDYQKNTPKKSKLERELSELEIQTYFKLTPIFINSNSFRIRIIYDGLNELMTSPDHIAESMRTHVGHMVDYVDSFPPQLIYYPEDKSTFLDEANLSWKWHQTAVTYLMNNLKSDVVIHSIYSPNQMLTSRWWLPFLDKSSHQYNMKSESERKQLWQEVKNMYRQADTLLGNIIAETQKRTGEDWYIVLSSDHGALPLYREVRLNNLFHQKKWLNYKYNDLLGEYEIDWKNTKVVYLQMNNIYINPTGLEGVYKPAQGPEYEQLVSEVEELLKHLEDPETKTKPMLKIWKNIDAPLAGLRSDRVGDLIISNATQYSWSEDITSDDKIFVETKKGGYKQGVWPEGVEGMLTPFVIYGPSIKNGCEIKETLNHVDQFSTLESIFNIEAPYKTEGRVLKEVFK